MTPKPSPSYGTDAEADLQRYAKLQLRILARLYKPSWTQEEKEQHRRDLIEQEAILSEWHPTYLRDLTNIKAHSRETK